MSALTILLDKEQRLLEHFNRVAMPVGNRLRVAPPVLS
jgi:hypothetical protein